MLGRRARLAAVLYGVAALAYGLDRLTKVWAATSLAGRPPLDLIPGVLRLTYTTNSGGAFGIGRSAPWLFAGATIVVVAAIVATSTRVPRLLIAVALGLVLGGALGNLTDRALGPALTGRVTDFIDLHVWPVFNLADAAIVLGAVCLGLAGLGGDRGPERSRSEGVGEPREG